MKRTILLSGLAGLLFMTFSVYSQSMLPGNRAQSPIPPKSFAQNFQSGSSYFEENSGQITGNDAKKVNYVYHDKDLTVFLLKTGIAYQFDKVHYTKEGFDTRAAEPLNSLAGLDGPFQNTSRETYRMDLQLVGANPNTRITTEGKSEDYSNYYNSNTFKLHSYKKVRYENIYPNIDWVVYKSDGHVKYDFVVKPGGNPADIRLSTAYTQAEQLNNDGSFTMSNPMGQVTEQSPVSYQEGRAIYTKFRFVDNRITFVVEGYDKSKVLTIDPTLTWSTYYGGSAGDIGYACSVDKQGNVFMGGYTQSINNIANGGYQNTYIPQSGPSSCNAFVAKFNRAGVRQWATYYGAFYDFVRASVAADQNGNVYLAAATSQAVDIAQNGHQNTSGGGVMDAYLVKFDSAGLRVWGTYYGGNGSDLGNSVAVDTFGSVFLCGVTTSDDQIAFNGHMNIHAGAADAFLVKFNSDGVRQWATYYGGTDGDLSFACATDNLGAVYLTGTTASHDGIAFQGHQNSYGGAFLVKFDSAGVRQWGTYYGSVFNDAGNSCAVDDSGNVYLAGNTESGINIAYNGFRNTHQGGHFDAFLAKFNSAGERQWGTYFGGTSYAANGEDKGNSCSVTKNGAVYLAGNSGSLNITSGGFQNTFGGGGSDGFIAKFNTVTGNREWASYFGGTNNEQGLGCVADNVTGSVYLCGSTSSNSSSLMSGGHQSLYGGGEFDGFLVKIKDECVSPRVTLSATPDSEVPVGTPVVFTAALTNQGLSPVIQWYKNDIYMPSVSGQTWTAIAGVDLLVSDYINVKVKNYAYCAETDTAWSNKIRLQPVGISDVNAPAGFNLFPNPAREMVVVKGLAAGDRLDIFNVLGQKEKGIEISNSGVLHVDMKQYVKGVHLFRFRRKNERNWTVRVIITE